MGQLQIEKKNEGDALVLDFNGQIDEDANFGGVDFENSAKVVLNLEKVSAINSVGIREWIKWIRTVPDSSKVIYKNCPKIIVDQINMVAGFLPPSGKVESFFVP